MRILTTKQIHRLEDLAYSEGYREGYDEGMKQKIHSKRLDDLDFLLSNKDKFWYKSNGFISRKLLYSEFKKANTPEEFCNWIWTLIDRSVLWE